jgi:uncharacterized protein (DUF1330 family)
MIVVTQLLYVEAGREADFLAFESIVLPLLPRYGGELLLRLRPDASSFVAGTREAPYEIHLVQFPDEDALARYLADPSRLAAVHLKDRSVRGTLVTKGVLG